MRTLLVVAVIGMSVGFQTQSGAQPGHDGLEGVWRFVSEVDTPTEQGPPVDIGPRNGSAGFLIYTADGHMSATIMPKARSWRAGTAAAEELRETIEMGTAYAGGYEVQPSRHIVRHLPVAAMDPADAGMSFTREYKIEGDRLTLRGPFRYDGKMMMFAVTFERVK